MWISDLGGEFTFRFGINQVAGCTEGLKRVAPKLVTEWRMESTGGEIQDDRLRNDGVNRRCEATDIFIFLLSGRTSGTDQGLESKLAGQTEAVTYVDEALERRLDRSKNITRIIVWNKKQWRSNQQEQSRTDQHCIFCLSTTNLNCCQCSFYYKRAIHRTLISFIARGPKVVR